MKLEGIERALQEGCRLRGFRSGGGLRVIRIEKEDKCRGYGEHPNVDDALSHANEDFIAGGRSQYKEIYGVLKPHYLTGSKHSTSYLDNWLLQGKTIDAYVQDGSVVVELQGLFMVQTPDNIVNEVIRTGKTIRWENRGYLFESSSSAFPSGKPCCSSRTIKCPEGKSRSNDITYSIVKTGRGNEFFVALEHAYEAEPIEIPEKED